MPPAVEYTPDDPEVRAAAEAELRQRRELHTLAWRYYRGRQRQPLPARPRDPQESVTVNLVRQAVDRLVAFVAPEFPGLELDTRRDTDVERWLRGAWHAAGGARLLARMALYGCLDGHNFARVLPADEAEPAESETAEPGAPPFPRVVLLNPANALAFWQADDAERVLWYELRWSMGLLSPAGASGAGDRTEFRQDVVRDRGGWLIRDFRRDNQSANWALTGESPWPYPLGPVVDWPHDPAPDRYYGDGEASNLALNDRVNRIASDIARILRYHAAPRTVGTGFLADDLVETGIDNLWTIAAPEARVSTLEMGSDLSSSMNFLQFCANAFFAERRVVITRSDLGDLADLRHVTNLGIRAMFMDQLARTAELRRSHEVGLAGLSRRLLMLAGLAEPGAAGAAGMIRFTWPEVLPVDTAEAVGVLERERALGIVSRESMARERGRDWLLERERLVKEEQESHV